MEAGGAYDRAVSGARKRADAKVQIALLRGINVGGNRLVPMAALREIASGIGWSDVATYIQSGNVVFRAEAVGGAAEAALEAAIGERFGFAVEVIVRGGEQWRRYAKSEAFADAQAARPNLLLLAVSKRRPKADAVEVLRAAAKAGERVEANGDALWIDLASAVGTSKLTPAVLDRAVGSTVTTRNWRTVQTLAGMVGALG